jgi:hypothetical protein
VGPSWPQSATLRQTGSSADSTAPYRNQTQSRKQAPIPRIPRRAETAAGRAGRQLEGRPLPRKFRQPVPQPIITHNLRYHDLGRRSIVLGKAQFGTGRLAGGSKKREARSRHSGTAQCRLFIAPKLRRITTKAGQVNRYTLYSRRSAGHMVLPDQKLIAMRAMLPRSSWNMAKASSIT